MKATLRGKRYKVRRCRMPTDALGWCDPPDHPGKEIRICHTLKGEKELDVTIHELLHACFWDMDETAINDSATDIARVLWRMGYRRT
jgi:hypothetical protein